MANQTEQRPRYHHGNLPQTLIAEGARLLAERGVDGFSMREAARRAGVAPAAPSHHFGGAKGLLTAIAADGFDKLADLQAAAADGAEAPADKIAAMCQAYIDMCRRDRGRALIMFRLDLIDAQTPQFQDRSRRAFDQLGDALAGASGRRAEAGEINRAAKTLWAAMHGLVALEMIEDQEAEEIVRFAVQAILAGMR